MDASGKGRRQVRKACACTCGRVWGAGTAAGAFLSFGLMPLASAPAANADIEDVILDPILNSLSSVDPALATDLTSLVASVDPSFSADSAVSAALPATVNLDELFQQYVATPLEAAEQAWITSSTGEQVDNLLNTASGEFLIGNGAPGTEADPNGGAGGLLFGDGGAGWNSTEAGVAGGNGGDAGLFGDGGGGGQGGAGAAGGDGGTGGTEIGIGGDGGNGGDGATGGDGGDGGNATGLFDNGGNGGNGGDSTDTGVLPTLGGAGGEGGSFGDHGAVGDYGTLASGPPSGASALSATGTWLTNSAGQVVIMHGFNEVIKVAPYEPSAVGFSDDDAAFLAANGFNAVRLGVDWAGVEPEPGVFDDSYLASLQQTMQTLQDHGIYVILDMHQDDYSSAFGGEGAPAWATETGGLSNPTNTSFQLNYFLNPAENHAWDAFWSNADAPNGVGLEDDYAQMWEHVANYFKGDSDVVGYEIMNEPWPGSLWPDSFTDPTAFGEGDLTPFYNQVDSAIRAVDPSTPVYFEPTIFGSEGLPLGLGTVNDPNTVFSFHDYCVPGLPDSVCGPFVDLSANTATAYANSQDIPALMTEFGSTYNGLTDELQTANQHMIGWTEWTYSDPGTTSGGSGAALVTDPSQPLTGDNVDAARLATLAQPYPQEISGTPGSYSFENGVFQFSYTTAEVNGSGDFPAGSQTTISVPSVEFPDGYTVSVTGGEVVSAPNAADLVIASNSGASTISVTVSPAT